MSFLGVDFIKSQFKSLPYPHESCAGKIAIVTGANVGLGLETARHFTRLGAAKVVIACRNAEKGEAAKEDIETATGRKGVVEVWALDLESYDSVRELFRKANGLERVDFLIENASVAIGTWKDVEGWESTVTVNVLSTFLLAFGMLPVMKRTANKHNVQTHLVVVSSDACTLTNFEEHKAPNIYEALQANKTLDNRYSDTKLMQLILTKYLAQFSPADEGVTINCLNPGLCRTSLFRHAPWALSIFLNTLGFLLGRSAEVGSRNIMAAAFAEKGMHGKYMSDCEEFRFPKIMDGEEGHEMQEKLWAQTLEVLEDAEPGVTMIRS